MPPLNLHWFLPMGPDVGQIGTWPPEGAEPRLSHLADVVLSAEQAGLDGLLVPTALVNHVETWTTAAAVLARTERALLILAVRPNQFHPVQAAKMTSTLMQHFPGRVALNIVTGAWKEDAWIGCLDDRERRYRRVTEWLDIFKIAWAGADQYQGMSYHGDVYQLEGLNLYPPVEERPLIYFSGGSPPAIEISARFADVHMLWVDVVERVAAQVEMISEHYTHLGRTARFAVRAHVIVRESEGEAWSAAERLIARIDPRVTDTIARNPSPDSPGRSRQDELSSGSLLVAPHLWAGPGLGRYGVATAIVGDPEQVIQTLVSYRIAGVDTFILSGYPKLDEAATFGRLVTRRLHDADRAWRRSQAALAVTNQNDG